MAKAKADVRAATPKKQTPKAEHKAAKDELQAEIDRLQKCIATMVYKSELSSAQDEVKRLGAEVEVIEFGDRVCPGMDNEIAQNFAK